jgi:hypothetical protein
MPVCRLDISYILCYSVNSSLNKVYVCIYVMYVDAGTM